MESAGIDLFATKGLEYILVIGYLLLLAGCRRMVGPRRSRGRTEAADPEHASALSFDLREGLHYHQGHTWALAEGDDIVRVGVDDFAQTLLGPVTGVILPRVGERLSEGEPGWKVRVGRQSIPMLSPVEGEVVAWNEELLGSPGLLNREPYDRGWLLKVRVRSPVAAMRNLLSGTLAHAWRAQVVASFDESLLTQPDRSPDAWDRLARELLLDEEETGWTRYRAEAAYGSRQGLEPQTI